MHRRAINGGAVGAINSTLVFTNTAFTANEAVSGSCNKSAPNYSGLGGGVYLDNTLWTMESFTVSEKGYVVKGRERERERESLGLHLRDGNALLDPRGLSPSHTRHTHVHVCASCPPSGVSSTLHLVPLSLSSGFWLSQASPFQHRGSSTTRLVAAVVESMQRPRTGPIGKITTFRYKVGVRVSCFSFTKTRISWAAATADDTT